MNLEDRLRATFRDRAERIGDLPDRWDEVAGRADEPRRASGERLGRVAAAAVALAVATAGIGLAVTALRGRDAPADRPMPSLDERSFDGWTVSVSVEPSRVGPIEIAIGTPDRPAPKLDEQVWLDHRIRFENTGDARVTFADTRTAAYLGDRDPALIAADEGCGYGVDGETGRVDVGACAQYLDAMVLEPGGSDSRRISLMDAFPGAAPLREGEYVFERTIRFAEGERIPDEGEGTTAVLRVTYLIARAEGATTGPYASDLGWTAETPEGWHVLEFGGFTGRYSVSGTAFSSEPLRTNEEGGYPDLSELFPDGAAVIVTHRVGGPAPDVTSDDSSFPLRFGDFQAIPGGTVEGSILSFRANGLDLTATVAIRADAPTELLEEVRGVIASIRPTPIEPWTELPSGFWAIPADLVAEVGSAAVAELGPGPFMVVHAPGGWYALDLPADVPPSSEFTWDADAMEVVWTQQGEVFARYDREGVPVLSPPAVELALLEIRPVVRAWDGRHLLLHTDVTYGPLPDPMWR